jgi:hypothetical protein
MVSRSPLNFIRDCCSWILIWIVIAIGGMLPLYFSRVNCTDLSRYDRDRERDRDRDRDRDRGDAYRPRRSPPRDSQYRGPPPSDTYVPSDRRGGPPRSPSPRRPRPRSPSPRRRSRTPPRRSPGRDFRYRSPPKDVRYRSPAPRRERSRSPEPKRRSYSPIGREAYRRDGAPRPAVRFVYAGP